MSDNVIGGKLKLKVDLKVKKKKRSRKRKRSEAEKEVPEVKQDISLTHEDIDVKTEEEIRFEQQRKKQMKKKIKASVTSSYREKIDAMNTYLEKLPVHNDIPKVASAGIG